MLLSACAAATFEAKPEAPARPCPPIKRYSAQEQTAAAGELARLSGMLAPATCVTCGMMDDYLLLRDQCRPKRPAVQ